MNAVYLNSKPSRSLSISGYLLDAIRIGLSACVAGRKRKPHPDSKRQRGARVEAIERREARRLKAQYVPLYYVDPTVYMQYEDYDGILRWRQDVIPTRVVNGQRVMSWSDYGERVRGVSPTGRLPRKPIQAVYMPSPSGEWRRHELRA